MLVLCATPPPSVIYLLVIFSASPLSLFINYPDPFLLLSPRLETLFTIPIPLLTPRLYLSHPCCIVAYCLHLFI